MNTYALSLLTDETNEQIGPSVFAPSGEYIVDVCCFFAEEPTGTAGNCTAAVQAIPRLDGFGDPDDVSPSLSAGCSLSGGSGAFNTARIVVGETSDLCVFVNKTEFDGDAQIRIHVRATRVG
jgi:hypothetical protein